MKVMLSELIAIASEALVKHGDMGVITASPWGLRESEEKPRVVELDNGNEGSERSWGFVVGTSDIL